MVHYLTFHRHYPSLEKSTSVEEQWVDEMRAATTDKKDAKKATMTKVELTPDSQP